MKRTFRIVGCHNSASPKIPSVSVEYLEKNTQELFRDIFLNSRKTYQYKITANRIEFKKKHINSKITANSREVQLY